MIPGIQLSEIRKDSRHAPVQRGSVPRLLVDPQQSAGAAWVPVHSSTDGTTGRPWPARNDACTLVTADGLNLFRC